MDNVKRKKLQSLLQKLMVIAAVLLLIACFVIGAPTETNGTSMQSFLWMITLMICIGAVVFQISEKTKPLDWVILGSLLGSFICLCQVLEISNGGFTSELLFCLYLLEFLISAAYRIGNLFHIFD